MSSDESRRATAAKPAEDAMRLHPFYRGKVQTMPKCALRGVDDFSIWYTPGVAAPCRAIQAEPEQVWRHTNRGNTVAIVSDGSRVLGLGDIGPEAALPVMEGKALLFKYLGGVDAVPLCLRVADPDELIRTVRALAPAFGGINLEDIAQPRCFRVLDELRAGLDIPVWHDDQQGTATVLLAGLMNALEIEAKRLADARIVLVGMGAANVAVYRLLAAAGADPGRIVACDSGGVLHRGRADIEARQGEYRDKWRVCRESNAGGITGGVAEALREADAVVAFSRPCPGLLQPAWLRTMAPGAIVFACANPEPEIWPWDAAAAGADIVATGRGDFPNQLNNALAFPGIFRGVLDVRATAVSDGMAIAAARELAACAREKGLARDAILPRIDDPEVPPRVAAATAAAAQREGLARVERDAAAIRKDARAAIGRVRTATEALMRAGVIPAPPARNND